MKERKRILELLKEGKISADEAVKLLEAVNKSYAGHVEFDMECIPGFHHHPRFMRKHVIRGHRFGHADKRVIVKLCGDDDLEFDCCD